MHDARVADIGNSKSCPGVEPSIPSRCPMKTAGRWDRTLGQEYAESALRAGRQTPGYSSKGGSSKRAASEERTAWRNRHGFSCKNSGVPALDQFFTSARAMQDCMLEKGANHPARWHTPRRRRPRETARGRRSGHGGARALPPSPFASAPATGRADRPATGSPSGSRHPNLFGPHRRW